MPNIISIENIPHFIQNNAFFNYLAKNSIKIENNEEEEENESEEEKSEFATGFFNFEEESVVSVTDGLFDSFETKVKTLEGGVNLNLVDDIGLALSPFAGVRDVKAVVDPTVVNAFFFDEATVYTGLKLALAPIDILGLEFALYNVDKFGGAAHGDLGAAAGFGFSVGLALEVEQAFFSLEIADALEPTWAGCRTGVDSDGESRPAVYTHLYNDFTYAIRFNFFNFIKDTLNTGLYVDGELELDADWGNGTDDDAEYQTTAWKNEFNIGLITNPIEWFEGYFGFNMINETSESVYDLGLGVDEVANNTWTNKFGIKFGTTFFYKCVSFDLNWCGYVGNFSKDYGKNYGAGLEFEASDWEKNGFTQEITFTVGVALE